MPGLYGVFVIITMQATILKEQGCRSRSSTVDYAQKWTSEAIWDKT